MVFAHIEIPKNKALLSGVLALGGFALIEVYLSGSARLTYVIVCCVM